MNIQSVPHRFILPKKGVKHTCPYCGSRKSFRRYVDATTGLELSDNCGICDHKNRCGANYPPRELFRDHPELRPDDMSRDYPNVGRGFPSRDYPQVGRGFPSRDSGFIRANGSQMFALQSNEYHQTEFFPFEWAEKATSRESTFSRWFMQLPYAEETKRKVLAEYYVGGTEKDIVVRGVNYGPAAIFWMIDEQERVHDAKLIAYKGDGHRAEGWGNSIRSICEKTKKGPQLEQTEKVLFGLHLINRYPDKVVCIVESEKSALICACHYPDYVWLATGGCGNLQPQKLQPLMNRTIVVYPDSGEYHKWSERMKESGHRQYTIVNLLERYDPNTDIADVILGEAKPPKA
ncbi:MAG: DUF6371 domain-containing protein [Bacteroidaceae bacterium]|nr:DUF6371 domain-containing protein [Bacteroidaceae bacterium]